MGYTYNITFVISPEKEGELKNYLRNDLWHRLFHENIKTFDPTLKKVVEIGGEKPDSEHGVSIALSVCFESEIAAHEWHDKILMPILEDFHLKFGKDGLFFITLLENLS